MKMNYEAPVTELIYFCSKDILTNSIDDTASGKDFTEDTAEM